MGGALAECATDGDCPGTRVCYVGVGWLPSNVSASCLCSGWYGWRGDACDELGPTTYMLVASTIAQAVVATALALMAWRDVTRIARAYRRKLRPNAAMVTLGAVAVGLPCHAIWVGLYCANALMPQEHVRMVDGTKLSKHSLALRTPLVLAEFFLMVAAAHLSVMWVELADQSRRLSPHAQRRATGFMRFVLFLEFAFAVANTAIAVTGAWAYAVFATAPFLFFVLVVFVVGRLKMVRVLECVLLANAHCLEAALRLEAQHTAQPTTPEEDVRIPWCPCGFGGFGGGGSDESGAGKAPAPSLVQQTRVLILVIKRCFNLCVLGCFGIVVTGLIYLAVNAGAPSGFTDLARPGGLSVPTLVVELQWWFVLELYAVVFWYVHRTVPSVVARGPFSGPGTRQPRVIAEQSFDSLEPRPSAIDSSMATR